MDVYVPFDAIDPKRRLAPVLSADERQAFAEVMLADVLDAVRAGGNEATVLATAPVAIDADVEVDDRPLTPAVNARLAGHAGPVAVVMADLPLLTPETVQGLLDQAGDVVIAPGLGGGTNGLVVRSPEFRVDYHGCSFRDHRELAREANLTVSTVDSYRLGLDVDEPDDLVEVLLHADGRSADWLIDRGFRLRTGPSGRVGIARGTEV